MRRILAPILALILGLAGCGGDGDSSSGGSGAPTGGGAPVNLAALAGTFAGTARITLSALGASETDTVPVRVVVSSNGTIRISFDDDVVASNQLAADGTFRITDAVANAGVEQCNGNLTITGRVTAAAVTATISSSGVSCSGIPGSLSGSLNAARQ